MKTIIAIFLILHGLVHGILVMVPDPDSPEAGFARFFSQSWLLSALGLSESAGRIIPEEQQLQIGDKIRLSKGDGTPYFVVQAIEPGRAIILGGDDPPTTWSFILEPMDEHSTRLIIRFRQKYEPSLGNVIGWRVFTDPITFVMERKMLQGIKARAEAT